ncbi:hypothetical protein PoB_000427300 [Plakobranchus ocellatus]|uniref:Uncharacterized protein n=1 Tax=Plakobranchus ocellatus TaxID=259542 RepID=A0AAV3Y6F6_9GAST|nr:hypothetical protein PoB_000427300 [Plakobranchus ocellatus]
MYVLSQAGKLHGDQFPDLPLTVLSRCPNSRSRRVLGKFAPRGPGRHSSDRKPQTAWPVLGSPLTDQSAGMIKLTPTKSYCLPPGHLSQDKVSYRPRESQLGQSPRSRLEKRAGFVIVYSISRPYCGLKRDNKKSQ